MEKDFDPSSLPSLWGKLSADPEVGYHPLACRMLDVAAVALGIWDECLSPSARRRIADSLGVPEDSARAHIAFWASQHDLGKASPAFKLKVTHPSIRTRLREAGLSWRPQGPSPSPHGTITAAALPELLTETTGLSLDLASRIGVVVGGHHGTFPNSLAVQAVTSRLSGSHPGEISIANSHPTLRTNSVYCSSLSLATWETLLLW